jgi:outer membrane receptor protein involved in Fe transport
MSVDFMIRFILIFFFCQMAALLTAQNDSIAILKPERLTEKDVLFQGRGLKRPKVTSATRTPELPSDLPFTVWVITADDINRNGFTTLGDVLKAAPGIRVSQPGNALEGETFLIRGLSGNQYVKILINDVPIKPNIALGMPIGAQLPIRQAERIEVFYGPAGAVFGSDACAGVVNIILKETERPIFTQADLSFGRFGYNSLDLMFGGKLGKDKRIFRFNLYGNSTIRENTDIYYDKNLFNTNNYLPFGLDSSIYIDRFNYRGSEEDSRIPRTAPIGHESRLLGINLTWRGIRFTYHRMKRFDHTALGLNPLAVSYNNPSNRISERMETFMLGFKRQRARWTSYTNLSYVGFKYENPSTSTFIFDRLSAANYAAYAPYISDNVTRQIVLNRIYDNYASNERFSYTNGFDARLESRIHTNLGKHVLLDLGLQGTLGGGVMYNPYHEVPVEASVFGDGDELFMRPFSLDSDGRLTAAYLMQLQWKYKNLKLTGGFAYELNLINDEYKPLLMPRLGGIYMIDSTVAFFGNYSLSGRQPTLFATYNSFTTDINNQQTFIASNYAELSKQETVQNIEGGIRFLSETANSQISVFQQESYNLVRNGYFNTYSQDGQPFSSYGYAHKPGKSMSIWGVQGIFSTESREFYLSNSSKRKEIRVVWLNELYMQYSRGKEYFNETDAPTSDVTNMPRWMMQFRSSWRTGKFQFMIASNRQKNTLSKSVWYKESLQRQVTTTTFPAFRTWDVMTRLYLSNHFLLYFHMQNVFNRHYAGIDASGTSDDLLYNPQQGRTWRLGVNYNMN